MAVNSYREDEKVSSKGKIDTIKRLLSYLLDYKKEIILVLFCMLIAVGITLVNPLLIEYGIDKYIAKSDVNGLIKLGGVALSINLVFIVMVKIRMYVMAKVSNKILLDIRTKLYEHIQTLTFSFFDSRPTGKILSRVIGDVNSLKQVLSNTVTILIPDFVCICGVIIIMFAKEWRLALASLCSIPILMIAVWIMQKQSHIRWQNFRKKGSNVNAYVHENISGMKVVQGFNAEDETKETFSGLVDDYKRTFIKAVRITDMFGSIVDICWGLGAFALYYVGVSVIGINSVSIGTLVAFGTYIGMFWNPVMNLSNFYNQMITNIAAAERIFEVMDTKADIEDESDVEMLPEIRGKVEFKDVSFTYDKGTAAETKVLDKVSFRVKPGETIALVGPTGAGKSTIVNLISRFYDVQEGRILIDGMNVKNVTLDSLRKQMGVMTQDSFIFHGTIRENIAYGNLGATDKEIIEAAKAVSAHDFIIKLKDGYDTRIKEGGGGLSAGQRQLIALARTMISKPKILILDEATSSIDTATEIMVQKGIETLLKGRTSFIIAHRLSTIQNADRVFVIDDGGIVEQGTPYELMNSKGKYYDLIQISKKAS